MSSKKVSRMALIQAAETLSLAGTVPVARGILSLSIFLHLFPRSLRSFK